MRRRLLACAAGAWLMTFGLLVASVWGSPYRLSPSPVFGRGGRGVRASLLSPQDNRAFAARFAKEIWPLITRKESNCLACHSTGSMTPLKLFPDAESSFKTLLTDGHLDAENPGSLLARLSAPDRARRMPPAPNKPWSDAEIQTLRAFSTDLYESLHRSAVKPDEIFPPALLAPYTGPRSAAGPDNTFLTYYQLKGKVKAIFGDDWVRDGRDLFNENIALFGGADFLRRFDESSKASAGFLTGVEMMSRDVASRAYMERTGPVRGFPAALPSPLRMKAPDSLYRREISLLFDRLLFRNPTGAELRDSFRLLQNVYREQSAIASGEQEARFELTVRDAQGRASAQGFSIRILPGRLGLYQEYVNQNEGPPGDLVKKTLNARFTLKAGDAVQRLEVSNRGTSGNVSVEAVELRGPLPSATVKTIPITDPSVQAQGAWNLADHGGVKSYEDEDRHKGSSSILIPLKVAQDGSYEVALRWRRSGNGRKGRGGSNADNVPVEVFSHDPSRLASPPAPPAPPKGEARFLMDQSDDTRSFVELGTVFRFGAQDGVEIVNADTRRTVVADAVRFLPSAGASFIVTGDRAEGHEGWSDYNPGEFNYYQKLSPKLLSDGNANKGQRHLLYRPAALKSNWKPEEFYRVQVCYPGREGNETRAPVIVHAQESAPIVQVSYPWRATVGAEVMVDASASYNLQRAPLSFAWRQIGGPRVRLRADGPILAFTAPAMTAQQAAWEGLCRTLMQHPDFLFTRPRSLTPQPPLPKTGEEARQGRNNPLNPQLSTLNQRRRLQLVKIAQDLVARTPTGAELKKLDSGAPLGALIDHYLNSREFRDFYFRRIRLYLESHGTESDDEPARLWCYIAFHDRPFKEILTADYTVDAQFHRVPRPAYFGHSGVLTMRGFIRGKPGLPHYNYAAQVCEKFLGFVFEVPPSVVAMRNTLTAASTTNPNTVCYSCHKILTPLAYQRSCWTDDGDYRPKDEDGLPVDDSDRQLVPSYPFKGKGLEAFALQAQNKERFLRTILQTHFIFYFGREMRWQTDERALYKRLWDVARARNFAIRPILKALLTSPEYLNGGSPSFSLSLTKGRGLG
jgi:hypothetical protein